MIDKFQGEFAFLSNNFDYPIKYDGIFYRNNEAAFQAQKTDNELLRKKFSRLLPSEAYRRGRKLLLRSDWEKVKEDIMYSLCKIKFSSDLKQRLLDTKDEELVNSDFSDTFWGVVDGKGQNKLGKILMKLREELSNGAERTEEEKE